MRSLIQKTTAVLMAVVMPVSSVMAGDLRSTVTNAAAVVREKTAAQTQELRARIAAAAEDYAQTETGQYLQLRKEYAAWKIVRWELEAADYYHSVVQTDESGEQYAIGANIVTLGYSAVAAIKALRTVKRGVVRLLSRKPGVNVQRAKRFLGKTRSFIFWGVMGPMVIFAYNAKDAVMMDRADYDQALMEADLELQRLGEALGNRKPRMKRNDAAPAATTTAQPTAPVPTDKEIDRFKLE